MDALADGRAGRDSQAPSRSLDRRVASEGSDHTMSTDLARWQFATTSIYHFLFVPVTIGLAFLVALLQTSWYRNDEPDLPAADPVLRRPCC